MVDNDGVRSIGVQVGFKDVAVIGNYPLQKDFRDYSLGLISAILDVCPAQVRRFIKSLRKHEEVGCSEQNEQLEFREEAVLLERVENAQRSITATKRTSLKYYLSAGIILFGFEADDVEK